MLSAFITLSYSAGNLLKISKRTFASKGDVLYINSPSLSKNYILITANKTTSQRLFNGNSNVCNLSCNDLSKYKHSTFKTNLLINGKGAFPFTAMSFYDILLLDCDNYSFDENDPQTIPKIQFFTRRTLLVTTIFFLVELCVVVNTRTKFQQIPYRQRTSYTSHKIINYSMIVVCVFDALWLFMTFLKVNTPNVEMDSYYSNFINIKILILMVIAFIDVCGFPIVDSQYKIDLSPILFFVFIFLSKQEPHFSHTLLLCVAWMPVYIFKLHSDVCNEKVEKFKVHLMDSDPGLFNLLKSKGLAKIPFDIQRKLKLLGLALFASSMMISFLGTFDFWQEIESFAASVLISTAFYINVNQIVNIDGIILENLVPNMLVE